MGRITHLKGTTNTIELICIVDHMATFSSISDLIIISNIVIYFILLSIIIIKRFYISNGLFLFFSVIGLLITFVNLIYSNSYIIGLGTIISIFSLIFIIISNYIKRYRVDNKSGKPITAIIWILFFISMITLISSPAYVRPVTFFILISFSGSLIVLKILFYRSRTTIIEILFLSIIIRASGFFITKFPVGTDPIAHNEYVNYFFQLSRIDLLYHSDGIGLTDYYLNYPIMHVLSVENMYILNINSKNGLFIIGLILGLSVIFIYLLTKRFNIKRIGLIAILLISINSFHLQWSIQVIAMTLGMVYFTIILFLLLSENNEDQRFRVLTISFFFILVMTHTISSFICLAFILLLFIYNGSKFSKITLSKIYLSKEIVIICSLFLIIYWQYRGYTSSSSGNFFSSILSTLINSLYSEATVLDRVSGNYTDNIVTALNTIGFFFIISFGILGTYFNMKKHNFQIYSLIFISLSLFAIMFAFPVIGLRNILPYRWPSFIFIIFSIFASYGIFVFFSIFKKPISMLLSVLILSLLIFSNITNSFANVDSPIYAEEFNQKLFWKDSEITSFLIIDEINNDSLVMDIKISGKIFQDKLLNNQSMAFQIENETLNFKYIKNKNIIIGSYYYHRPVQVQMGLLYLFNEKDQQYFETNYNLCLNSGSVKYYTS